MPLTYVSILTTHGQIGYKLYDPNIYGDVMVKNVLPLCKICKDVHHDKAQSRDDMYLQAATSLVYPH